MTRRTGRREEDGVSNVLGAVLMFGLFVLVLVTIQVRFVPVWDEDREARHMAEVNDQLRLFKSDLDRQAINSTSEPITDPLTLKQEGGFRFFRSGSSGLGTTASFQPSPTGTGVELSSPNQVRILNRDGQQLYGLSGTWPAFVDDEITGVSAVNYLRQRVDMTRAYTHGDSVTFNVYSALDDVDPVATAVTTFLDFPSEQALQLRVLDSDGDELSSSVEAYFQQTAIDFLYFDLLADELLFDQLLAISQAPLRLELIEDGLTADYQIAYGTVDAGNVGAGGLLEPDYATTVTSGRLEVAVDNQRFVDQTYVLEHGGIILAQKDGTTMLAAPALQVSVNAAQAALTWAIPGLQGSGSSQVSSRSVSLVATPTAATSDVDLLASRLAIDIPTAYGAAWCDHLDTLLSGAGLSSGGGTPQYTLLATSTACQLELFGPVSAPADTSEDISLRFHHSAIDLALTPSS